MYWAHVDLYRYPINHSFKNTSAELLSYNLLIRKIKTYYKRGRHSDLDDEDETSFALLELLWQTRKISTFLSQSEW